MRMQVVIMLYQRITIKVKGRNCKSVRGLRSTKRSRRGRRR